MIEFEIGDKVKVVGQSMVGEVIDIDYGENIVTISDLYAETNNSEYQYKADELQFLATDHDEDGDMDSLDEMRDMEMRDNGYKWDDWN
jgi:hypothetical protein|tara:strand:+ start:1005 stop:1268 length:264 start_codon:yes stop_codon:yes gene_type:complete